MDMINFKTTYYINLQLLIEKMIKKRIKIQSYYEV